MQAEGTVHFVGIGGIGMSGIARMLVQAGVPVSGSDIRESAIIKDFRQRGATIFIGHDAENVQGAREIVVSSAIRPENPELVEARRLGLPIIHRSKKLAELLNSRRGITIAGTHGKTTTSSLAACVLSSAGVVPSYVVGGIINTLADNARAGDSEWFVIEADESDGTLVAYHPEIAILTNVELDHMDFYRDLAHLHEVFGQHVRNIRHGGAFIYCADDEGARRLARETAPQGVEAIPYGITSPDAAYAATDIKFVGLGSTFTLVRRGESVGRVHLSVPGQHNVLNSLAVVAAGERMGLPIDAMIPGLEAFTGVQRRFQVIGRNDHYMVVDDYAHHPSEIKATLSAARSVHRTNRIIGIFQPHRYSRTQSLATEFGAAFGNADQVIITGIYSAGEDPIADVSSDLIVQSLRENNHPAVHHVEGLDSVEDYVAGMVQPNDLVITLGAGDIWKVAQSLALRLTAPAPAV